MSDKTPNTGSRRNLLLAAAGLGNAQECAAAVLRQMDLGADSVIIHGAAPSELAPMVEASWSRSGSPCSCR